MTLPEKTGARWEPAHSREVLMAQQESYKILSEEEFIIDIPAPADEVPPPIEVRPKGWGKPQAHLGAQTAHSTRRYSRQRGAAKSTLTPSKKKVLFNPNLEV